MLSPRWPEITLDRTRSAVNLRRQITRQLLAAVRAGGIPPGARLPSSRLLAEVLGVSRGTVVSAYEELLADGALITKQGSGIYVAPASPSVPAFNSFRKLLKASQYPAQIFEFEDPDGSPLYLNLTR